MKKIYLILLLSTLVCGNLFSQTMTFGWAKALKGTNSFIQVMSVTDNKGNVYTIGDFYGTADLDPGPGVSNMTAPTSYTRAFIQKLDSSGNFVFAKMIGDDNTYVGSIGIDDSMNVYCSGSFTGTEDLDPGPGIYNATSVGSGSNGFLLKLDTAGNFIWVKTMEGGIGKMTVDSLGNCYACGYSYSMEDFDPGPGIGLPIGTGTEYVVKYNNNGNLVWARAFGNTSDGDIPDLAIDAAGNVYLSGKCDGPGDYDPGPGVFSMSPNNDDLYFLKLNASGNFVWGLHLDVPVGNFLLCRDISCDAVGNLYLTGSYSGNFDFDPTSGVTTVTSPTYDSYFLLKVTHNGGFGWVKSFGNSTSDLYGFSVTAKENMLYTSGYFSATTDFDPGPATFNLTVTGSFSFPGYIHKLDTTGNFIWARSFGQGSNGHVYPRMVELDDDNDLYLVGTYTTGVGAMLDFNPFSGTSMLTGSSNPSGYILKINQYGCDEVVGVIDSVHNVTCANPGYAIAHAYGGTAPYTYQWNSIPVTIGPTANFDTSGIYQLSVTDAGGCLFQREFMLFGPSGISPFDLQANMVCNCFRPGFDSHLWLDAFNESCDTVTGTLYIVLDSLVSYNSAVPSPDVISGDTLKWDFDTLNYDLGHIVPEIYVTTSTGAVIGDSLYFDVVIAPITGDADNTNNFRNYRFPIVSSYDPNDKKVYPQGECDDHLVLTGQKMTYTVRFQNTGNADAINIYVLDSLDSDLDLNTVRVIGNSHNLITEVLPGNVLKFRFDNIHLPDSTSDETNSHGYVIYEVDQMPSLPTGTLLENTAYIYFDFNPAVVTNTVSNMVVPVIAPCLITTQVMEQQVSGIKVYPNPTTNTITVSTTGTFAENIGILDLSGRTILNAKPAGTHTTIDLSHLQTGIYFVKTRTALGESTVKLVKQ